MPLPAHQLLHPACTIKPAWAVFDEAWYLRRYADARAVCAGKPAPAALVYYLQVGARLGHSPSALFDEIYYLDRNPDITALVRAGQYQSGFDHFCRQGHRGVSPHWLFDDALYGELYEDMTLETLDQHGCYGRYDHYLKSGQRERRMGQFLFDAHFYRAQAVGAGVDEAEIDAAGPFVHFLQRLSAAEDELAPSAYFDPVWYVEQHPRAKGEIGRGRYTSALHHYLTNPEPEIFDPVPQFSERFYRQRYPDIATAIEHGFYRSAYQQFVQHGAFELRQPTAGIDLAYYRDLHARVRDDVNAGVVRDAFAHLRLVGLAEGLAYQPPDARPTLDERETRALFMRKAEQNLLQFTRGKLDFSYQGPPALTVVMVLFNRFALSLQALSSLRENYPGAIQLIIVDNGSADLTKRIAAFVSGFVHIRNENNVGFLRACNQALGHVAADALLFLNNDVELGFGAVDAALARLRSAPDIGAIGAKIIRTNGLLQEAGSIIWADATVSGYSRDGSPLAPEVNFVRDVDYASGVFLLCRTALVQELGGFDDAFAPAYFEDADLCVRLIQAGFRIVYDPRVVVMHLEFGSAVTPEASMALMRRGRRVFKKKHEAFLATRPLMREPNILAARSRGGAKRILFIEDTVPLRRLGSGFVRSNDVLHALTLAGHEVHVFPLNGAPYEVVELLADCPERVEILYDRNFIGLADFLAERAALYDLIWVARTHNFARVLPLLRQAGVKAPVILDTEAVAAARDAARAMLRGEVFDLHAALAAEFENARMCARVLCVSEQEAALLHTLGVERVAHLGTARVPSPTPRTFAARDGLFFAGAIHQEDSPNLDALRWCVSALLPALRTAFGEAPVLHIAGYVAPGVNLMEFRAVPGLVWHGEVDDLTRLYDAARLFIAPTRFAAGTAYKIYESAGFGLPCVASDLLVAQLGWASGREILSAAVGDAAAFAKQISQVYHDETLWTRLRAGALTRLETENSMADFNQRVAMFVEDALGARPPAKTRKRAPIPA